MTESSHAVFLSYASQDAEATQKICGALRAAAIEVWFDQSELRGGDAWDQSIRKQIKTCALFLPVISRNTHNRVEGYFRLEWKLADAHQAIALAPELAEGHVALGFYLANGALDLKQAFDELERARALAHGAATVLRVSGLFAIMAGRTEAGVADLRRAVTLDPLNALTHMLGFGLYLAHRYEEARAANAEAISLDPELLRAYAFSGLTDYSSATSCAHTPPARRGRTTGELSDV